MTHAVKSDKSLIDFCILQNRIKFILNNLYHILHITKKANGIFSPLQSVPYLRNPEMGRHIVVRFLVNCCVSCPATKAICSMPRQWLYMAVALIQTGNGMVWMSQCYQNVRVRSMFLSLHSKLFMLAYSQSIQNQKKKHSQAIWIYAYPYFKAILRVLFFSMSVDCISCLLTCLSSFL